jgi:ACR3 family arsenite efflux pump ArsB
MKIAPSGGNSALNQSLPFFCKGLAALLAVPILIQVYFNAGLAYWLNRQLAVEWCVAGPSALIGASNRP